MFIWSSNYLLKQCHMLGVWELPREVNLLQLTTLGRENPEGKLIPGPGAYAQSKIDFHDKSPPKWRYVSKSFFTQFFFSIVSLLHPHFSSLPSISLS